MIQIRKNPFAGIFWSNVNWVSEQWSHTVVFDKAWYHNYFLTGTTCHFDHFYLVCQIFFPGVASIFHIHIQFRCLIHVPDLRALQMIAVISRCTVQCELWLHRSDMGKIGRENSQGSNLLRTSNPTYCRFVFQIKLSWVSRRVFHNFFATGAIWFENCFDFAFLWSLLFFISHHATSTYSASKLSSQIHNHSMLLPSSQY